MSNTCRDCIHKDVCYKRQECIRCGLEYDDTYANKCGDFVADLCESYRLRYTYEGCMDDEELEELLQDFCDLLYDVEWQNSGEISEEDYRKSVAEFKKRWLK